MENKLKGLMTSKTDQWNTPTKVTNDLAGVFDWDVDVCASGSNVCKNYYDIQTDGLSKEWVGLCWMNPPYGRGISKWVAKAASSRGVVVCLLPARTDTKYFHDHIKKASLVVFLKGRLYFNDAGRAPFPSMFVVFGEINEAQIKKLSSYGWAINQQEQSNE